VHGNYSIHTVNSGSLRFLNATISQGSVATRKLEAKTEWFHFSGHGVYMQFTVKSRTQNKHRMALFLIAGQGVI